MECNVMLCDVMFCIMCIPGGSYHLLLAVCSTWFCIHFLKGSSKLRFGKIMIIPWIWGCPFVPPLVTSVCFPQRGFNALF